MFDFLKKYCARKAKDPKKLPRMYETGGVWGSAINWFDLENRRVVGWLSRRPMVGDYLKSKLKSGKVGIFRFTKIKLEHDPPDMFFGTVEDLGYEGEVELPEFYIRSKGEICFI